MIKRLIKSMDDYRITPCVNMIILADHGMAAAGSERVINLPEYIPNITTSAITFVGSFSRIRPRNDSEEVKMTFMDKLVGQKKEMRVYPKEDLPTRYHFSNNRRIESIVLDLDAGWTTNISYPDALEGQHGYDNFFTSMNALFIASGPDFKTQMETEPFQNIELYNLMCYLTGVTPSPNNGTFGSLHHILANPPAPPTLPPETKPPTSPYPTGDVKPFLDISECPRNFNVSMPWLGSLKMTEEQQNETEARHLPWGVPHSSSLPASITLLHHLDHVTGYSQVLKMPLWTSFTLQEVPPSQNLTEMWSSDLRLNKTTTATCSSYFNLTTPMGENISMFPLFPPDFSVDESLPPLPFLVSNLVPGSAQLEAPWQVLMEELVPAWLDLYGPLNLLLGPVFDNNADSLPDNLENFSIPEVPSDLFAVVTRCKVNVTSIDLCPPNNLDAVSFIIPEEEVISNNLEDTAYLLEFSAKVHDVELVTGLTFFPALDFQPRTSLILRIQSQLWTT
ncbi:venom phosphodiesterase isoform X1 [Cherax quadricarinatus]